MPPVGVLNSRWPRAGPGRALSRAGSETLGEGTGHRLHPTELGGRTGSRANFLGHGGGGGEQPTEVPPSPAYTQAHTHVPEGSGSCRAWAGTTEHVPAARSPRGLFH